MVTFGELQRIRGEAPRSFSRYYRDIPHQQRLVNVQSVYRFMVTLEMNILIHFSKLLVH
jgi:hypothetical protein